jgi:putative salt-induced outer membrane protein YdiY
MRNSGIILALIIGASYGAICASASDTVYLKNGDRISGSVEKFSDSKLVVKSTALGELKINIAEIDRVEAGVDPVKLSSASGNYDVRSVKFTSSNADLVLPHAQSASIPLQTLRELRSADVKPVVASPVREASKWSGSIDAGMSAARGNSQTTNLNLGFKAAHTTTRDQFSMGFVSLFAQSETSGQAVTSANAIHSGARYDVNVSENSFTFAIANFDSDQLQNLDLRSILGGGLGVRLSQSSKAQFNIFAGGSLNNEFFTTQPDRRSGELLTGQELSYTISPRAGFSQRVMFFPNLTDRGEYRVAFDSTATLKFNKWLGWQSTLSNTFVSNPVPGTRNNDLLLTTGIRFSLGAEQAFKPRLKMPAFTN